MSLSDVNDYLSGPFHDVNGWCTPYLWNSIQPLVEAMAEREPLGPIAEIGVFHGKFFIGLVKTAGAARKNYAIDVFDLQEFNLDKAGVGNLETLKRNMQTCGVPEDSVEFLKTDSMWLGESDITRIREETGGFSLFSIDGCHLAEHTINDMMLAMALTRPNGLIFVDDYYNPNWPGVQEGVAKFYLNTTARFVPVLYSCNKLFLCNLSFHSQYLDRAEAFIRRHHPATRLARVKRFGFETLNVMPDLKNGGVLVLDEEQAEVGTPAAVE